MPLLNSSFASSETTSVGAGPVPARTPERRSFRADILPNGGSDICPDGQSGWHGACPYTGGMPIHRGQAEHAKLE